MEKALRDLIDAARMYLALSDAHPNQRTKFKAVITAAEEALRQEETRKARERSEHLHRQGMFTENGW
jgi:hypothetical protein